MPKPDRSTSNSIANSGFSYGSAVDGNYDQTKPWDGPGDSGASTRTRMAYNGPFSSNEERLTQQAILAITMPAAKLQELVRPNLPQIQLFPERFGYPDTQPGIEDVVTVDRVYMEPRVSWFSGGPAGYSGSTRNGLEGV